MARSSAILAPALSIVALIGAMGCNDLGVRAIENDPPVVEILSHIDGDVVREGYTINAVGTVSDDRPVGELTALKWYGNEVELCSGGLGEDENEITCTFTVPVGTELRLRLHAEDARNKVANHVVTLQVDPNDPPTVDITSPIAGRSYYDNTDTFFRAILGDDNDTPDLLTGSWESDLDGPLSSLTVAADTGTGVTDGWQLLSRGTHMVTLTVEDLGGQTASDTVTVTVGGPNTPPTCGITFPGNGQQSAQWNEVLFAGLADDQDVPADELTAVWSSDVDGELGSVTPSLNGDILFPWDQLSLGNHTITLTVADDAAAECTDTITHEVIEPPLSPVVQILPADPEGDDDLVCSVLTPATDALGNPLPPSFTYAFTWDRDGTVVTETATASLPGDAIESRLTGPAQAWTCSVSATNGMVTGLPGTDTVTIALPSAEFVTVGQTHGCLLDTTGFMACWGEDNLQKLDLQDGIYLDFAAGNHHTCAIDTYGIMQCRGLNNDQQVNTAGLLGTFKRVDAGDAFNCAIDSTDGIQCWGDNSHGQSGGAPTTGSWGDVSVGFRHACAVERVASDNVTCWGHNSFGQSTPPPGITLASIAVGKYHSCGLDQNGQARCWGRNLYGESFPPSGVYSKLAAGEGITCGLRGDGTLVCWGTDDLGEISDMPSGTFIDVAASNGSHLCAVRTDGGVDCWGNNMDNTHGQLTPPTEWW